MMKFLEIELAYAIVVKKHRTFKEGKEAVENQLPSRWNNPALIAVSDETWETFKYIGETEIFHFAKDFESLPVVAIPNCNFGYGNRYQSVIDENRRRFDLA
jgi:hypothetical protein